MNIENFKKANDLQIDIKDTKELLGRVLKLKNTNNALVITNYSQAIRLDEQEIIMFLSIIELRLNEKIKKLEVEFDGL